MHVPGRRREDELLSITEADLEPMPSYAGDDGGRDERDSVLKGGLSSTPYGEAENQRVVAVVFVLADDERVEASARGPIDRGGRVGLSVLSQLEDVTAPASTQQALGSR
jgi:hypothetical protein